jgi:hypothetical protein
MVIKPRAPRMTGLLIHTLVKVRASGNTFLVAVFVLHMLRISHRSRVIYPITSRIQDVVLKDLERSDALVTKKNSRDVLGFVD